MRRVTRLACALGAIALGGTALWAFAPLASQEAPAAGWETPEPAQPGPGQDRPAIDRSAFAATIWNPVAARDALQQSQPSATEQARPLRIQLIAIIDEGDGRLRAALYDQERDRLFIVATGDRVGGHTVTSVAAGGVELTDGRSATRLALREGRS